MHEGSRGALLLLANALLGASILVFAVGFFPHKAVLPGLATWSQHVEDTQLSSPFDRVIFMVVDALRSDFVYGNASNFHFTQSLIRAGAAIPFTGHASPPTITMPRVKAITTGSVPSFIDLVLNFAESDTSSTLATQDSWLAQMRANSNGKLVMFGDDTWLRLFPGFFERSDGTTSFFVSDFTEVDYNVTRNIASELQNDDWSAMVLHYLGLDHIGHKTGPQGPNMPAKQQEMDGIVRQIFGAMEHESHLQDSLLVLLGDHGMNEAGGHGASSSGETSTALTFISPKFKAAFEGQNSPVHEITNFGYYDVVEQSDIAATLAALLGFPIPKNSLGIIIPKMLELWSNEKDRFNMLYMNAEQIQAIARATFVDAFSSEVQRLCAQQDSCTDEELVAYEWQKVVQVRHDLLNGKVKPQFAMNAVNSFLMKAQAALSGAASQYDLGKMGIGIALAAVSLAISVAISSSHLWTSGMDSLAFVSVLLVYGITMFASSYVEEEHQFWFWSTSAWLVVLTSKACRSGRLLHSVASTITGGASTCLLFGLTRRWNTTGQKYAGDPDLVTEILSKTPWVLWTLILVTYATISRRLSRRAASWGSKQMAILPVVVTISAFLFKLAFTAADAPELLQRISIFNPILAFITQYPLVSLARIVFLGLGHLLATALFYESPWQSRQQKRVFLESFHDILSLLLITQTRTVNIPLFLLLESQASLLRRHQHLQAVELTVTSILLQFSSFFIFGGTNAISSVDLSNAYNGISGFNFVAVGILIFVSNWAGPIWWTSATAGFLAHESTGRKKLASSQSRMHFALLTLFMAGSTLAVMIACMVLREHLFIWTVFSPKYLYTIAWTFGQHFVINGLFGTLILGN